MGQEANTSGEGKGLWWALPQEFLRAKDSSGHWKAECFLGAHALGLEMAFESASASFVFIVNIYFFPAGSSVFSCSTQMLGIEVQILPCLQTQTYPIWVRKSLTCNSLEANRVYRGSFIVGLPSSYALPSASAIASITDRILGWRDFWSNLLWMFLWSFVFIHGLWSLIKTL